MAWVISLDGALQRLSLSANISLAGDFSLTVANVKASATTAAGEFQAITGTLNTFENFIAARTSAWQIRINNNNFTIPYTVVREPTTRGDMTAVRVGNQLTFGFGGDLTTITVTTANFVVGCFGIIKETTPTTTHSFGGELGDVTLDSTNLWDATASDHSNGGGSAPYPQPIVIDTVSGNNAVGVGFSTTDLGYWVNLGGDTGITGDSSTTLDSVSLSVVCAVGNNISGTLSVMSNNNMLVSSGGIGSVIYGIQDYQLGESQLSSNMVLGQIISGLLGISLENNNLNSVGNVGNVISGTLDIILENIELSSTMIIGSEISGSMSIQLDDVLLNTSASTGEISGSLAVQIDENTLLAIAISGITQVGENDISLSIDLTLLDINLTTNLELLDINLTTNLELLDINLTGGL